MNKKEYNGWTNYETWVTALHIGNEASSCDYALGMTREALSQQNDVDTWTKAQHTKFTLADMLKDWIGDDILESNSVDGLALDLMRAAVSEVNWDEIASHYIGKVADIDSCESVA